jgi:hypothetical protein
MNTPNQLSNTPRTDAVWAASFSPEAPGFHMRDLASTLERELSDRDSGYMRGSRALLDSALMWKDRAEKSEAQLAAAIARAEHAEAIIRSLCKICSTPIGATSEDSK